MCEVHIWPTPKLCAKWFVEGNPSAEPGSWTLPSFTNVPSTHRRGSPHFRAQKPMVFPFSGWAEQPAIAVANFRNAEATLHSSSEKLRTKTKPEKVVTQRFPNSGCLNLLQQSDFSAGFGGAGSESISQQAAAARSAVVAPPEAVASPALVFKEIRVAQFVWCFCGIFSSVSYSKTWTFV